MNFFRSFFFFLFLSPLVLAKTYLVGPSDNWFGLLHGAGLQPGDEVVLKAGTYSNPRMLVLSHVGTVENPIVIRATEGARVVFRRPDARQNTFNLANSVEKTCRIAPLLSARFTAYAYQPLAPRREECISHGKHGTTVREA